MSAPDLVNKGFIVNHADAGQKAGGGRTFIVTGLYRSGTTLIASVLRQVGIFMGAEINDIVHEDEAMARILAARDRDALTRIIAERNMNYGTWGFKFPMLCNVLDQPGIGLFSDPRIIVTFRDPVSVAVRTSLSEYQEPMQALKTAIDDQTALVTFVDRLSCPTLLLSYEKSLMFPADFINAILQFCDLPRSDGLRDRLIRLVEPNRQTYIAQARRRYEGLIEGTTDGRLNGWCRLTGVAGPVMLELLVEGRVVLTFPADLFRQDLLDAGFGTGHHGFSVDLGRLPPQPGSTVRIKVAGRDVELDSVGARPWV